MLKKIIFVSSILLILISPFFGEFNLILNNIFISDKLDYKIFWDIRIPRLLLAFFSGAILSLSGIIFQTIFRNPMSTPFTLGVASGSTLFTAIAIILGFNFLPFFSFLGAISTVTILFFLSSFLKKYNTSTLLLLGIALSFFYSSLLMITFYISNLEENYQIVRFTMGSLDVLGYNEIILLILSSIFLLFITLFNQKNILLLLVSNEFAHLKGVNLKKLNAILLISSSIVIGISVTITGPIGFVGLVIPHTIKMIYKESADKLILPIFFYG
jgi:iron complex transport system permease protein